MPPFGLFVSEFMILTAAFGASRYFIAIVMMVALSVVFGALLHHFQNMLAGKPPDVPVKSKLLTSEAAVMGVCAVALVILGVRVPATFAAVLQRALVVLQ
jgi:formate hydrogenlyase subunit 3/multisubunit Na+/H+ antiporter MnhD subunit